MSTKTQPFGLKLEHHPLTSCIAMTLKAMKAAKAVAPPKRHLSTKAKKVMPAKKAMKVFKAMKAMKAAKAMKAMKAATDYSVATSAAMPFMGTWVTKMPGRWPTAARARANKRDTQGEVAGGALPPLQPALQQSWHIDTRNVPEIWVDGPTGPRPALPGDKILFKFFKPN